MSEMSFEYRAMIYFATATLHFYRGSIKTGGIEGFRAQNADVIVRVDQEALNLFKYELSYEQMNRAIAAYLAPAQTLDDPAAEA